MSEVRRSLSVVCAWVVWAVLSLDVTQSSVDGNSMATAAVLPAPVLAELFSGPPTACRCRHLSESVRTLNGELFSTVLVVNWSVAAMARTSRSMSATVSTSLRSSSPRGMTLEGLSLSSVVRPLRVPAAGPWAVVLLVPVTRRSDAAALRGSSTLRSLGPPLAVVVVVVGLVVAVLVTAVGLADVE